MTIFLLLILVLLEVLRFLQFGQFFKLFRKTSLRQKQTVPPKARNSFVVKRMEERLKEALYE